MFTSGKKISIKFAKNYPKTSLVYLECRRIFRKITLKFHQIRLKILENFFLNLLKISLNFFHYFFKIFKNKPTPCTSLLLPTTIMSSNHR